MNKIEKMEAYLGLDKIKLEDLETFFEVGFKMEINPLPLFRKWLKRNDIDVEVHFSDKPYNMVREKGNRDRKKKDIVVIRAIKGECGRVEGVQILPFCKSKGEPSFSD